MRNLQLNFSISFDVAGNFSNGLPVFSDTRGCRLAEEEVSWLFATRAMLFALLLIARGVRDVCRYWGPGRGSSHTALVLISSFSTALAASSPAPAAGVVEGAAGLDAEDALGLEGVLEGVLVVAIFSRVCIRDCRK